MFWADRVKAEERVVARNYPCSNETQCKNMCVGEDITVIERTTGSGGKDYYCNKGYVSGSIAAGEKCEKQSDCSAGLYCHNGTFRNTCEQKMQDEISCIFCLIAFSKLVIYVFKKSIFFYFYSFNRRLISLLDMM